MDASPLMPKFEIPLLGKSTFYTEKKRTDILVGAAKNFINHIDTHLSKQVLETFDITQPTVHFGDIASGDQFISDKSHRDKIKEELPEVLCVEMEGAAVAQVCFEYNIPFTIIRTISDNSNDNSHLDFPKFAKEIASEYALGVIKNYFNKK